jgi:hypothetical protein
MIEPRIYLEEYVKYLDRYANSLTQFSKDIQEILAISQGKENEEQLIIHGAKARWRHDHPWLKVFLKLEEEMGKRSLLPISPDPEAGGMDLSDIINELPPPSTMASKSSTPTDKPKPPTPTDRSK